jgi:hypothetical protein
MGCIFGPQLRTIPSVAPGAGAHGVAGRTTRSSKGAAGTPTVQCRAIRPLLLGEKRPHRQGSPFGRQSDGKLRVRAAIGVSGLCAWLTRVEVRSTTSAIVTRLDGIQFWAEDRNKGRTLEARTLASGQRQQPAGMAVSNALHVACDAPGGEANVHKQQQRSEVTGQQRIRLTDANYFLRSSADSVPSGYDDSARRDCRRDKGGTLLGADRPELVAHRAVRFHRISTAKQSQQRIVVISRLRPYLSTRGTCRHERHFCDVHAPV